MIPISFPIAHHPSFRNPPTYVYLITLLLPEDDTSDVIPHHTMLRHAYHVSATRNFRLTPITPPTPLRDLSPLPPPSSYASPSSCALGHALARRARVRRRSTHVRQPSACRLPAPPFPTHLFHVKHARTIIRPAQPRERIRHAPGLPVSPLRSEPASVVLAALALLRRRRPQDDHGAVASRAAEMIPIGTHLFHVKPRRMIIPVRHHFAPQT